MEDQRSTDAAKEYFETAIQVITQARIHESGDELDKKVAWGMRAWLMGESELATGLRATYVLLEQVNHKLDRLEQSLRR
jgi:hypothetical protein